MILNQELDSSSWPCGWSSPTTPRRCVAQRFCCRSFEHERIAWKKTWQILVPTFFAKLWLTIGSLPFRILPGSRSISDLFLWFVACWSGGCGTEGAARTTSCSLCYHLDGCGSLFGFLQHPPVDGHRWLWFARRCWVWMSMLGKRFVSWSSSLVMSEFWRP